MALLSTEDSNDSQNRMRAVLTIHPTLAYPFFSLIRPLFLRVLPKGGWICKGLLYPSVENLYVKYFYIVAVNVNQRTTWLEAPGGLSCRAYNYLKH